MSDWLSQMVADDRISPLAASEVREKLRVAEAARDAALGREAQVVEALKTTLHALYEQEAWEADFITQPEAWRTLDGLPVVPQDILGRWITWGYVRRDAMKTARAALAETAGGELVEAARLVLQVTRWIDLTSNDLMADWPAVKEAADRLARALEVGA